MHRLLGRLRERSGPPDPYALDREARDPAGRVEPYAGFPRIVKLDAGRSAGRDHRRWSERKSGARWRRAGSATALGRAGRGRRDAAPRPRDAARPRDRRGGDRHERAARALVVRRGTRWSDGHTRRRRLRGQRRRAPARVRLEGRPPRPRDPRLRGVRRDDLPRRAARPVHDADRHREDRQSQGRPRRAVRRCRAANRGARCASARRRQPTRRIGEGRVELERAGPASAPGAYDAAGAAARGRPTTRSRAAGGATAARPTSPTCSRSCGCPTACRR